MNVSHSSKTHMKRKQFPFTTSTIHEKTPACHRPQTERTLGLETYYFVFDVVFGVVLGVRHRSWTIAPFVHGGRTVKKEEQDHNFQWSCSSFCF
jgi:hypothetical protein